MAKDKSSGGKSYRDAGTGQFVTKSYADKHPKSTLGEARGGGSTHYLHPLRGRKSFLGVSEATAS